MALDQQKEKTGSGTGADGAPKTDSRDNGHALRLQRTIARARAYHAHHDDWVKEFNTLTHGQCADGDGVSYRAIRNWQAEHHLEVDGLIGPATLAAARELAGKGHEHKKEETPATKQPTPAHDDKPAVEHVDPEAKQIVAEAHTTAHDPPPAPPPTHTEATVEHKPPQVANPPPPPPQNAAPTAAVAGDNHAVHPSENLREVNTNELESSRGDKNQFAHSADGYRKVYKIGNLETLVFLPGNGIVPPNVDVFLFFHGMYADFATNDKDKNFNWNDPKNSRENPAQGADMARAVTQSARNVIAIMPMQWPNKGASYHDVVEQVVARVGNEMALAAPLKTGKISVSGHSLGGVGIGEGVKEKSMMDAVTDVTLQDAGYGDKKGNHAFEDSFKSVRDWLLLGKGPKTLRLITENDPSRGERTTEKTGDGLNAGSFRTRIEELKKDGTLKTNLVVSGESFGAPPKHFTGAFLELRVDIAGPDGKQGSMYVFREQTDHFGVRDQSMKDNIAAGSEAGFGVVDGKQPGEVGTSIDEPKHKDQKPAHKPEAKPSQPEAKPSNGAPVSATPTAPAAVEKKDPPKVTPPPTKPAATEKQVSQTVTPKDVAQSSTAAQVAPPPVSAVAVDAGDLQKAVDALHDPKASSVAQDLASLVTLAKQMLKADPTAKGDDLQNEVHAAGRNDFVAQIEKVHAEIAGLDGGADPKALAAVKGRMFRTIQELSPYYSQYRNVDILQAKDKVTHRVKGTTTVVTRTCNLTSLGMALEGLGKGPSSYMGSHDKIAAVGKEFNKTFTKDEPKYKELKTAELVEGSRGADFEQLKGLRMPDFLELAAVAHYWNGKGGSEEILAAAATAWPAVMDQGFLRQLAEEFGVTATVKFFRYDASTAKMDPKNKGFEIQSKESGVLQGQTHAQRSAVDKLIEARNHWEAVAAAKGKDSKEADVAKKAYLALEKPLDNALNGAGIEKHMPIADYKKALVEQIGADLDGGGAVQCSVIDHYVRVHAINDDHIVIDDPASAAKAHKKVLFEEARAQGMFYKRMVIR